MRWRVVPLVLLFVLSSSLVAVWTHSADAEEPTYMEIVNPLTGTGWFNFNSKNKGIGDTFIINITVVNVERMVCWQFALQWNSSLLECVNVTLPSDNALRRGHLTEYPIDVGGSDLSTPGLVVYGASSAYPGEPGFNGSGVLAQVEMEIKQSEGQCELSFEGAIHIDTFLLSRDLKDMTFTPVNGYYAYNQYTIYGDVDNNGTVDMKDVMYAVYAFNSVPGSSQWNPRADLDSNGRVDMRDITIVVLNFNKHA